MTSTMSRETRERLEREVAQLREQRQALAPPLGEHETLGDSADQAGMLERAEAAAWLDRRIAEVDDLLEGNAEPEQYAGLPPGTEVELRFSDGTVDTLRVIGIAEEVDHEQTAVLTPDSPLGHALIGRRAGETIRYQTPRGEISAEIVSVRAPTE